MFRYYSIEFELLEVSGKTVLGVTYWQVLVSLAVEHIMAVEKKYDK